MWLRKLGGVCVFVIMDLGQRYESSGVLQGLLLEWDVFLFCPTNRRLIPLHDGFLAKQTNRFFVSLSPCLCSFLFFFCSSEEKTQAGLWLDTGVTQITSTALVACKDDILVGMADACCAGVYVCVCVCVCVCGCLWFKSFPVHLNDDVTAGISGWRTGTVEPMAASVCG